VRLTGALTIDRADIAPKLPTPSGVVPMDVVEKNRPVEMGQSACRCRRDAATAGRWT
jgi:translocation and assembly module TamB